MADSVDCVVIGAGVIGLAVARALAQRGREVVVLEAADAIGTETSARNSEIIHAGIYYPGDSNKARFCVEGKALLYRYCAEHGIEHRRCGKLIVATHEAQRKQLEALKAQAEINGVDDLEWLSAKEATGLEPELRCVAALLSPSTGLIDSHGLMLAYQGEAEDRGVVIAFNAPVAGGEVTESGIVLDVGGAAPMRLDCRSVVNSAGLQAPALSASLRGLREDRVPRAYFAKGNYYKLNRRAPFGRLIYPVPEPGGLGVHITLDLGGQARFGPDVEWIEEIDYDVDPARADKFYAAIRTYWPGLPDDSLSPDYAGIRPKIVGPGEPAGDFRIDGPDFHDVPGLANLYGIESPGLTASLAIADHVASLLAA